MCATQNVAIKLTDHNSVYDDLLIPTNSIRGSLKSTLWFLMNVIWESRFRIPTVIILGIMLLSLSVHHEMTSRNLARRRRQRDRNQGWVEDESDDDDDEDDDDDDFDDDDDSDDDSDGDYESDDEDENNENRLFFPESMFFIDPNVDPENDAELFDFIRRENPNYERSIMRRQPLPSDLQADLVLSRCPRIEGSQ